MRIKGVEFVRVRGAFSVYFIAVEDHFTAGADLQKNFFSLHIC